VISYRIRRKMLRDAVRFVAILLLVAGGVAALQAQPSGEVHALQITVNAADGKYAIAMPGSNSYALRAGVGVEVDGHRLHASDYPRHEVEHSQLKDIWERDRVASHLLGIERAARLTYHLRAYSIRAVRRYRSDGSEIPLGRLFTSRAFVPWMRMKERLSTWEDR